MTVIEKYQIFAKDYGDSLSRYLGRIQVLLMDRLISELKKKHKVELSHSQFHGLQSLCLKGMSQNDLAIRLGISKQALSQLIKDLVSQGLISKEIDPNDSRGRILKHTAKGKRVVSSLIDISIRVEEEFIKLTGKENYLILKDALKTIEDNLTKLPN